MRAGWASRAAQQDRAGAGRAAAVPTSARALRGAGSLSPQCVPILAKSGYVFIAFLQVIATLTGRAKNGREERQFPVFVIIIGYIYRKKVN